MPRQVLVTFKIPEMMLENIDLLVKKGVFRSRSEALRYAISLLLREYNRRGQGFAGKPQSRNNNRVIA